jgi:hypothetical protein
MVGLESCVRQLCRGTIQNGRFLSAKFSTVQFGFWSAKFWTKPSACWALSKLKMTFNHLSCTSNDGANIVVTPPRRSTMAHVSMIGTVGTTLDSRDAKNLSHHDKLRWYESRSTCGVTFMFTSPKPVVNWTPDITIPYEC